MGSQCQLSRDGAGRPLWRRRRSPAWLAQKRAERRKSRRKRTRQRGLRRGRSRRRRRRKTKDRRRGRIGGGGGEGEGRRRGDGKHNHTDPTKSDSASENVSRNQAGIWDVIQRSLDGCWAVKLVMSQEWKCQSVWFLLLLCFLFFLVWPDSVSKWTNVKWRDVILCLNSSLQFFTRFFTRFYSNKILPWLGLVMQSVVYWLLCCFRSGFKYLNSLCIFLTKMMVYGLWPHYTDT